MEVMTSLSADCTGLSRRKPEHQCKGGIEGDPAIFVPSMDYLTLQWVFVEFGKCQLVTFLGLNGRCNLSQKIQMLPWRIQGLNLAVEI